jgi:hypothetical protein
MRKFIEQYIKNCDICWKTKAQRHKSYGYLQPIDAPERPWQVITWDFITDLPDSQEPTTNTAYNQTLVMCDKLTKYGYFIPWHAQFGTQELAYAFTKIIYAQHGMPEQIISDRDKLFTSKFWQTFTSQLGVKTKLSTAFHPQTDGQTERLNQTLEQYLRAFVNEHQDNWATLLPMAQLAYNSAKQETTQTTPFFANYGLEPSLFHEPKTKEIYNPAAQERADTLKNIHNSIKSDIEFLNQRMAHYYNQGRSEPPNLKEGDSAYLLRKNIHTTRPNAKLDFKKLGPYKILKKVHTRSYKLQLPANGKRGRKQHDVFHIALLEKAPDNLRVNKDTPMPDIEPPEDDEYEVEKILKSRKQGNGFQYLIKWKDYDETENTWEPTKHIPKQLIEEFRRQDSRLNR